MTIYELNEEKKKSVTAGNQTPAFKTLASNFSDFSASLFYAMKLMMSVAIPLFCGLFHENMLGYLLFRMSIYFCFVTDHTTPSIFLRFPGIKTICRRSQSFYTKQKIKILLWANSVGHPTPLHTILYIKCCRTLCGRNNYHKVLK